MPQKKKKLATSAAKTYEQFLKELKLVALGMSSSSSALDRADYWTAIGAKGGAARNITTNYQLVEAGDESFDTSARFLLEVAGVSQKTALRVECVFEAHFHTSKPFQPEFATRFANSELRILIWPYFRQFVSDTASRMAIPSITVPLSTESE